ncbi:MAG: polysaccharide deacetylase family protein [Solirubrobacteraceae bacterium]|nr:polysaccharide deacetylase family protein [Solirubrobacteraceae bacterium]
MPRRRQPPILFLAATTLLVVVCAIALGLLLGGDGDPDVTTTAVVAHAGAAVHDGHGSQPAAHALEPTPGAPRGDVVEGPAARRLAVPILMYHVLGTPAAGASLPELWVSKARFAEQLAGLHEAGYEAVTLHAVLHAWEHGSPLPKHPVVLSFDDGYLSHATVAAPAMRKYGWPGVVNVTTHNLGPDGLPRHLAQAMAKAGWEFDSHTLTHPDLREVSDAQLKDELRGSRREIRALTGTTPEFFCYPAGKYDEHVEAAVKAAGYAGATTVEPGIARRSDDPFQLPRVRITNADTGSTLVARLRSGAASAGNGPAGG